MQYKQAGQVYSIQIAKQMKKSLGCLQIKTVHTMQLLEEVEIPEASTFSPLYVQTVSQYLVCRSLRKALLPG